MYELLKDLRVPGPIPTAITRPFWTGVQENRFQLQFCNCCEKWVFYPRALCPHCWSDRLSWREASGIGRIKTFTVVHKPGHPAWTPMAPYALALIELKEGPTMLSLLVGVDPDQVMVGMPVKLHMTRVGELILPCFEPDRVPTGESHE
ncbi:Zn-ribbon domain-containing OB-fold protein [Noviherbaspirillum sedimenti]|uniref:DNA-binding protein n=1 Tax=Noviherbaspirillum sedimenti TaxID=2320865 RepID=A0A3A3G433_9BURK|nr:OB-fold domain-containing protein [Noviherbaspirillum sedimenti]RJG02604.1 hypothetical protein D3878_14320 [Noviherbaspirillum sedimenti]